MKKILILFVLLLFMTGCCGIISQSKGPSDEQAKEVIVELYGKRDAVILEKSECELTKNHKVEGITGRYVIRYRAYNQFTEKIQEDDMTIQERNGEWKFYSHVALCRDYW